MGLFRSFAKVIPFLPGSKVAVGATWDPGERHFPIETTQGSAVGNLYQSFTFDSVFNDSSRQIGALSWRFSYKIQLSGSDTGSVLRPCRCRAAGTEALLLTLRINN